MSIFSPTNLEYLQREGLRTASQKLDSRHENSRGSPQMVWTVKNVWTEVIQREEASVMIEIAFLPPCVVSSKVILINNFI